VRISNRYRIISQEGRRNQNHLILFNKNANHSYIFFSYFTVTIKWNAEKDEGSVMGILSQGFITTPSL